MHKLPYLLLIAVGITGCANTEGTTSLIDELDVETPEFIIRDADILIVQDQEFRVQVKSLSYFSEKDEYLIEGLRFIGYSPDREEIFNGDAGFVRLFNSNENIEMSEDIAVFLNEEGLTVEGEYFSWSKDSGNFSGKPDEEVIIKKTDGSRFQGRGFVINEYTQEIEFSQAAEGIIYAGDEEPAPIAEEAPESPDEEEPTPAPQ